MWKFPAAIARGMGAMCVLCLAACASPGRLARHEVPPAAQERDATGAYRFEMSQHGRRMSADEFDAWMRARGIRVAKGRDGATPAVEPASPASLALNAQRPRPAAKATASKLPTAPAKRKRGEG